MVKIMAVYDEDALYARRLAEYCKPEGDHSFLQRWPFSNLERLKEYGDSHEIEISFSRRDCKSGRR